LATSADITEPNSKIAVCEICHINTSASEKDFVTSILATATAGHTVLNAQNSTGVLECTTCHGAHVSGEGTQGALLFSTVKAFGTLTSDLPVDETGFNPQCTTCHDDDTTWFSAVETTSYPSVKYPVRVADVTISSGYFDYPKLGTFPGLSVVASSTQNAHAQIADKGDYNKGDCRYCHSSHNSASPYSQLLTQRGELRAMVSTEETVTQEEKTSGAYASFCLSCHNGSNSGQPWSKAVDIADVVSLPPGSTEASRTAFLASNAGHRVESANADVPSGSALPCYGCHNPHGSKYGNNYNLSDSLGANLSDTRDICLACHVTSDGFVCTDGDENLVEHSDPSVQKTIFGLSRSGIDSTEGTATVTNMLKLDDSIASHASTGVLDCDNPSCHGNVHSPTNSR